MRENHHYTRRQFLSYASLAGSAIFLNPLALLAAQESKHTIFNRASKHFLTGLATFRKGKYSKAKRELNEALRIFPEYADAHYLLGKTALAAGNSGRALTHMLQAIRHFPGHTDALIGAADICTSKGHYGYARHYYASALSIFAGDSRPKVGIGRIELAKGNLVEAAADAVKALKTNPFDAQAYVLLGDFYRKRENDQQSQNYYRWAKTINPTLEVPLSPVKETVPLEKLVEKNLLFDWRNTLDICLKSVEDYVSAYQARRIPEHVHLLEHSLEDNPLDLRTSGFLAEACIKYGALALQAGNLEDVQVLFDASIVMDYMQKNVAQVADRLDRLYSRAGDKQKAAHYGRLSIRSALSRGHQFTDHLNMTLNHLLASNMPAAFTDFMQKRDLDNIMKVEYLLEQSNTTAALQLLKRVIEKHSLSPINEAYAHTLLADTYQQGKQFNLALAEASKSLSLFPQDAVPHLLLYLVSTKKGMKSSGVEHHAMAALRMDPHNVRAYQAIAYVLRKEDGGSSGVHKETIYHLKHVARAVRFLRQKAGLRNF